MTNDPKTLGLALLLGIIPSLIWLWFWLGEDKRSSEPKGLLTIIFILGMASVIFVLPIQKFIQTYVSSSELEIVLWASAEEIMKYLAVISIIYGTTEIDEPVDWPIYMITAAVGFAALENALYIIKPLILDQAIAGVLTGHLRFLGATLLHSVTSAILGISLGLSFYLDNLYKKVYLFFGITIAISLHSAFNFLIIKNNGQDFLKVFSFLWVVTIIVMLLFEKLRRMA
ncbi:PrsW family intramembrane metalloprotease [Candidatus Nomurabacteria bacterium]|nr:PrsW family intramembrane metalloprotease [Candidatus Nomurabacteria bacterium]